MNESVYLEYLGEKQRNNERVKIYLKSKTESIKKDPRSNKVTSKINSIMLSGYIEAFDERWIRLRSEESIINVSDVISIKPDDAR